MKRENNIGASERLLIALFACTLILSSVYIFAPRLFNSEADAAGSANLVETGEPSYAYRPYLEWFTSGDRATTFGMKRQQVVCVYAYAGETILVGSNTAESTVIDNSKAKDIGYCTPGDSTVYYLNVESGGGVGNITYDDSANGVDNAKELLGPQYTYTQNGETVTVNEGGYTPLAIYCDVEGVYEFYFYGGKTGDTNPTLVKINDKWTSSNSSTTAAWDVTLVQNYSKTRTDFNNSNNIDSSFSNGSLISGYEENAAPVEVNGRAYTNCMFLNMGLNFWSLSTGYDDKAGLYSIVYVLTDDGFVYEVDLNGMDPFGFVMFACSRGLINSFTNTSLYSSARDKILANSSDTAAVIEDLHVTMGDKEIDAHIQLPIYGSTELDTIFPIFFEPPSEDLPSSVYVTADISNDAHEETDLSHIESFGFKGTGVPTSATDTVYTGVGGFFNFEQFGGDSYSISIEIPGYEYTDGEGVVQRDASTVILSGYCTDGTNSIYWDGKDGNGFVLPTGVLTGTTPDIADDLEYGAKITLTIKAGEYHFPMADIENNVNGVIITRLTDPVIRYAKGNEATYDGTTLAQGTPIIAYTTDGTDRYYNDSIELDEAGATSVIIGGVSTPVYPVAGSDNGKNTQIIDYSTEAGKLERGSRSMVYYNNSYIIGDLAPTTGEIPIDGTDYSAIGYQSYNDSGVGASAYLTKTSTANNYRSCNYGGDDAILDLWTYYVIDEKTIDTFNIIAGETTEALLAGFVFFDKQFDDSTPEVAVYDRLTGDFEYAGIIVVLYELDEFDEIIPASERRATTDELGFYCFSNEDIPVGDPKRIESGNKYRIFVEMPYPIAEATAPTLDNTKLGSNFYSGLPEQSELYTSQDYTVASAGMNRAADTGIYFETHDYNIKVTKVWEEDSTPEDSVSFTISSDILGAYNEPVIKQTIVLSEENNWQGTFYLLPANWLVNEVETPIVYSVSEESRNGWLSVALYENGTITNSGTLKQYVFQNYPVSLKATKKLLGEENSDTIFYFNIYRVAYTPEGGFVVDEGTASQHTVDSTGSLEGVTFDVPLPFIQAEGSDTSDLVYAFAMKENDGGGNYSYDSKMYYALIEARVVHDSNGSRLEILSQKVFDNAQGNNPVDLNENTFAEFINIAAAELTAVKEWQDVQDSTNEASFMLYRWQKDGNGAVINAQPVIEHYLTTVNRQLSFGLQALTDYNNMPYFYGIAELGISGYSSIANTGAVMITVNGEEIEVFPYDLSATVPVTEITVMNYEAGDIGVTKQWMDGNNAGNTRPETVTLTLNAVANGTVFDLSPYHGTLTLTSDNNWSGSFKGLPRYLYDNGTRHLISYSVEEEASEGYRFSCDSTVSLGGTITAKNILQKNVEVTKTWLDNSAPHSSDRVAVGLFLGTECKEVEYLSAENGWRHVWTVDAYNNLSSNSAEYSVFEGTVVGGVFSPIDDGRTIQIGDLTYVVNYGESETGATTITNNLQKSFTVSKQWSDSAITHATHSVLAGLYSGNELVKTFTLNLANNWRNTLILPTYDKNTSSAIVYSVKEGTMVNGVFVPVDEGSTIRFGSSDYTVNYSANSSGATITNTLAGASQPDENRSIVVQANWDDISDKYGNRPDSIAVELVPTITTTNPDGTTNVHNVRSLLTGTTLSATLSESSWRHTFTQLPNKVTYQGADYTISYSANQTTSPTGYTVLPSTANIDRSVLYVNDKLNMTTLSIRKLWVDESDKYKNRPSAAIIYLNATANNVQIPSSVISSTQLTLSPTAGGNWYAASGDLPQYYNGNAVVYSISGEAAIDSYTSAITTQPAFNSSTATWSTGIVTNTLNTSKIAGTVTWTDGNDNHPSDDVKIYVYRSDDDKEPVATITVKEDDDWKYSLEGLPTEVNGDSVSYSISSSPVDNYKSEVKGFDVTLAPSKGSDTSDNNLAIALCSVLFVSSLFTLVIIQNSKRRHNKSILMKGN